MISLLSYANYSTTWYDNNSHQIPSSNRYPPGIRRTCPICTQSRPKKQNTRSCKGKNDFTRPINPWLTLPNSPQAAYKRKQIHSQAKQPPQPQGAIQNMMSRFSIHCTTKEQPHTPAWHLILFTTRVKIICQYEILQSHSMLFVSYSAHIMHTIGIEIWGGVGFRLRRGARYRSHVLFIYLCFLYLWMGVNRLFVREIPQIWC